MGSILRPIFLKIGQFLTNVMAYLTAAEKNDLTGRASQVDLLPLFVSSDYSLVTASFLALVASLIPSVEMVARYT